MGRLKVQLLNVQVMQRSCLTFTSVMMAVYFPTAACQFGIELCAKLAFPCDNCWCLCFVVSALHPEATPVAQDYSWLLCTAGVVRLMHCGLDSTGRCTT